MKVIPIALEPQYDSGSSTLCHCLKITRSDGEVLAVTSADVDVTVDSVLYTSAHGLDVSGLVMQSGLAVNNLELTVIPDEEGLVNRADLLTGVWDNARFELFETNYLVPSDGKNVILQGVTGEVGVNAGSFVVEMRGLSTFLNQPIGIVTSKTCRAILGDAACTVDLGPFTFTGTLTGVTSRRVVTDSGRAEAADYFTEGTFTPTSGPNFEPFQFSRRVKVFASGQFTFADPFPYEFEAGVTYTVKAGCRKRPEDCKAFDNILNFQGEPHGRGIDVITATPEPDA